MRLSLLFCFRILLLLSPAKNNIIMKMVEKQNRPFQFKEVKFNDPALQNPCR